VLVLPPLWLITRVFAHRIRAATQDVRQQASRTMSTAEEAFSDLPSIQASARAEAEEQQYADRLQDSVPARLHQIWLNALNGPAIGLLGTAMGLVLVWPGANRIEEGRMTLGEVVAALGYVRSLNHPLFALARLTGHLQQLGVSVEREAEVLDLPVAAATTERSEPRSVRNTAEG
jgi:ABC-type bacteriocin/lantibiotic exporter with double-glycine peptidase domain